MSAGAALRGTARRRRLVFFSLTFLTSGAATALMYDILSANGFTTPEILSLPLFWILFTWISGAFWTAAAGAMVRLRGGDRHALTTHGLEERALRARTAILMPIYNEDTVRVLAGARAIWRSLAREREQHAFDFFILSDTRKPEIAAAEEAGWRELVAELGAGGRIFYRRRRENLGRKAGNIADFVRTHGGAYEHAVVLDADSVMSGAAIVGLARLMEANPRAGIVQALPQPAGRETLFARLIQFAARLSSPMLASGLNWWQLADGNYWGHNAILRLEAFAAHCDLPRLSGRPPLGGEILSHDFVEAAFIRRAGYEVWLAPELPGSWEEVPSNVPDYAARDRRWAQGNLQHLRLLPLRRLHWVSRLHLLTGVLSYVASPLWLAVLVLSSVQVCMEALAGEQYFTPGTHALFPTWPQYRDPEVAALLGMTLFVLFVPKLMAALVALANREERRGFGGTGRLMAGVLIEQVFSIFLAPAMMMFHTQFVLTTLAGRSVTWNAQDRGDRGIGFGEAMARHGGHVALAVVWGTALAFIAPRYLWWMSPVLAGLILSVPLTMLTSRRSLGLALRRMGLLATPEETRTPVELAEVAAVAGATATADASALQATGTVGAGRAAQSGIPALPAPAPRLMQAEPVGRSAGPPRPAGATVPRLRLVRRPDDPPR